MSNCNNQRPSKEFVRSLRTSVARFYPCDLHVHSLGSYDVCQQGRFDQLPGDLQVEAIKVAENAGYRMPLRDCPDDPARFDSAMATPHMVELFFDALVKRRDEVATREGLSSTDNWSVIAITDHNTAEFSCQLSSHAWSVRKTNRLILLPGIELDVEFTLPGTQEKCCVHILCIFRPLVSMSDIRLAISKSCDSEHWEVGNKIQVDDLGDFVRKVRCHELYPGICIAAHVWSKKGIQNEPRKLILAQIEAEIARLEGELDHARSENAALDCKEIGLRLEDAKKRLGDRDAIQSEILQIIGKCGFDGLQVRDQSHESHYRRLHRFREEHGRGIPVVSSDAHSPANVFDSSGGTLFAKLSISCLTSEDPNSVFSAIRDRVLRFGETRTTYAAPGAVADWIEGIEITPDSNSSSQFWMTQQTDKETNNSFTLELSRNLNCLVGGRGSGKSSGVEAIAFLTSPDQFREQAKSKKATQWYSRAKATLDGCRVRLVWKSTSKEGIGELPKKALILSRYFNPDGAHEDVEMRDIEDSTIVNSAITSPRVRILRVHEIEDAAEPINLRRLFDDLCGEKIATLSQSIERVRSRLKINRNELLNTIYELAELTSPGSPLRQYGIRKFQFESVNEALLQKRFREVDRALEAQQSSSKVREAWDNLRLSSSLESLIGDAVEFFKDSQTKIPGVENSLFPEYKNLADLIRFRAEDGENEIDGPDEAVNQHELITALRDAKAAVDRFSTTLEQVSNSATELASERSDALAREGLPAGSSERRAKKKAFDAAENDLKSYESSLARLDEFLNSRSKLRTKLVELQDQRTTEREAKAAEISAQLARDLDPKVLNIVIVAQRKADKSELEAWLETNVGPHLQRSRQIRLKAIIDSDLDPTEFRDALFGNEEKAIRSIRNERGKVDDGKIDASTAEKIVRACQAFRVEQLDESDDWNEEFRDSLPPQIRDGIKIFPTVVGDDHSFSLERALELDEVVLDDNAEIMLNDRPNDKESQLRPLGELSPGQRCSAILPIMLLSGDYPLIIDQPEENLDNRLIRQVIVNILAGMKLKRQVIIATHNPNLPVLGDAEQCVVLQARGRSQSEVIASGNLDAPEVAEYVTDIMEGGREAFQYRQSIYQHHWKGVVDG